MSTCCFFGGWGFGPGCGVGGKGLVGGGYGGGPGSGSLGSLTGDIATRCCSGLLIEEEEVVFRWA